MREEGKKEGGRQGEPEKAHISSPISSHHPAGSPWDQQIKAPLFAAVPGAEHLGAGQSSQMLVAWARSGVGAAAV